MNKFPPESEHPIPWQLANWSFRPLEYLEECYQKYGDIFALRIFTLNLKFPMVFVNHPQGIEEIFTADPLLFKTSYPLSILKPFVGSNSIFLLDGKNHLRERKLLMPPFHGERLSSYSQLICDITQKIASKWHQGETFLAHNAMKEITLEVIIQIVFGLQEGRCYEKIKPLLIKFLDIFSSPLGSNLIFFPFLQQNWGSLSPWGKLMACKREIYDLLQGEINQRRIQEDKIYDDILSLMMSACDENGEMMRDDELCDEMVTLLFAGYETTSIALAWGLYWVHKLPDIKAKLVDELDSFGDKSHPLTFSLLPYLTAVCQETLRIASVLPQASPRMLTSPWQCMGYDLPENTVLMPCIHLLHQREDLYPQSQEFRPERFLRHKFSSFEYLPFGGSSRSCIGSALGMLEMKLVLATLLTNYELTLAPQPPVKPQRRSVNIGTNTGIVMTMVKKR